MASLSYFVRERNIRVDDHALRRALAPLTESNEYAAHIVAFYDDPKRTKRRWRKGIPVEIALHADGLPKLTFAVFDSCVLRHYLDEERRRLLGPVLRAIGEHAKAPGTRLAGRADFCVEGGGEEFWFLLDYEKRAVFIQYQELTTVDFRDEATRAKSPATARDAWARVFDLQKTQAGREQLAAEEQEAKLRALPGIELRVSATEELISIEPIKGEEAKVRFFNGSLRDPTAIECLIIDRVSAERRAELRSKRQWRSWRRVEIPGELLPILQSLGWARARSKPQSKVVGKQWLAA
jgi:hypothetical protein